jgi:hypothetical protein
MGLLTSIVFHQGDFRWPSRNRLPSIPAVSKMRSPPRTPAGATASIMRRRWFRCCNLTTRYRSHRSHQLQARRRGPLRRSDVVDIRLPTRRRRPLRVGSAARRHGRRSWPPNQPPLRQVIEPRTSVRTVAQGTEIETPRTLLALYCQVGSGEVVETPAVEIRRHTMTMTGCTLATPVVTTGLAFVPTIRIRWEAQRCLRNLWPPAAALATEPQRRKLTPEFSALDRGRDFNTNSAGTKGRDTTGRDVNGAAAEAEACEATTATGVCVVTTSGPRTPREAAGQRQSSIKAAAATDGTASGGASTPPP